MSGAVLSSIVITCRHVLKLPQSSVAFQVRLIVYSCTHVEEATVISSNVIEGTRSQLSVALAMPVWAGKVLSVHSIVTFTGQVMSGAVLSSMVITCRHVLKLPQSSVAFQVRLIVYSCTQVVEATVMSSNVIAGTRSQLSVALAMPVWAGSVLSVHSIVTFTGHVISGAVLSSIVITCTHVLKLPQSSVAFQVRLIVYSCTQVADATVMSSNVIAGTRSQLSVALAIPVWGGSVLSVHSIVTFTGQVMSGAALSSIVIT